MADGPLSLPRHFTPPVDRAFVREGATTTVDLALLREVVVRGRVVDPAGRPLPGASETAVPVLLAADTSLMFAMPSTTETTA